MKEYIEFALSDGLAQPTGNVDTRDHVNTMLDLMSKTNNAADLCRYSGQAAIGLALIQDKEGVIRFGKNKLLDKYIPNSETPRDILVANRRFPNHTAQLYFHPLNSSNIGEVIARTLTVNDIYDFWVVRSRLLPGEDGWTSVDIPESNPGFLGSSTYKLVTTNGDEHGANSQTVFEKGTVWDQFRNVAELVLRGEMSSLESRTY